MSTIQLRRDAIDWLDRLPAGKVKAAWEFLAYLGNHASEEATAELLKIPGILGDLKAARREYREGNGVNWRKARKDV